MFVVLTSPPPPLSLPSPSLPPPLPIPSSQVTSIVQHILERKAEEIAECWPQIRVEETIPTLVKWAGSHDSHMTVTPVHGA